MRGVFAEVPQDLLDWRRTTGIDRFDEMWDGVLHMLPFPPNGDQQALEQSLQYWLHVNWAKPVGGKVQSQRGVSPSADWTNNYRVPDLILLDRRRLKLDRNTHIAGPPLIVVEIESPGDETRDKMPFYADLGIPEVWIVPRDTCVPELFELVDEEYLPLKKAQRWLTSKVIPVQVRSPKRGLLAIQRADDAATYAELPDA